MGCTFSSPQLNGVVGPESPNLPAGIATYYFNPTGPESGDQFGIIGSFNSWLGGVCEDPGLLGAYLVDSNGVSVTCNTITISAPGSILCPTQKTALPTGTVGLFFSYIATGTAVQQEVTYEGPVFEVATVPSTSTVTSCTPAPLTCHSDNCFNSVHASHTATAFCSSYLTGAPVSTPTGFAKGCSSSAALLSSACLCLNKPVCNGDNCLNAFSHTSSAASSFCVSGGTTPAFVSSKCTASRVSSACNCLLSPGPVFARDNLFGRLANPWQVGSKPAARDISEVTEVEVLVKRTVGYSGPDGTIEPGATQPTTTVTVLGNPTCPATSTV